MPIPNLHTHNQRWRSYKVARPRKRLKLPWLKIVSVLVLVGVLGIVSVAAWVSRDLPTPEGIARRVVPLSTKIYDRTSKVLLYDIHGEERRTAVELSTIPKHLINATLTAEDRSFYEHKGFRFTSMVRALLVNLVRGGRAQGASTITQQFIKNAIFTNEKLYSRKIKEVILAYQIERKFSKDEILKLYFNEIPYGSNAYGAEAAAQTFFGKSVHDLTLAESSILAAMAKAPTYYSPWGSHRDELMARQHFILGAMVSEGYIKEAEAETAKTEKLIFKPRRENIVAPHFVFYVRELLAERYGERAVAQGGLKIITTLDADLQKYAEEAIAASEKKNLSYNAQNASLAAMDVATGQVVAMVGSRDYFNDEIDGQVNVALRPRQPGSSFKPVVYGAAFELGFTPQTTLFDVVTTFKAQPKDYTPHNYDDKERGPVSLRQALAGSLNIPSVKLLYLTGIDRVLGLADRLGYTTLKDRSRFGFSLVLGGAEVTLLEHTAAFAVYARDGQHVPTAALLRVEDSRGDVLEEWKLNRGNPVLTPQAARELTSVLSDNDARSFIFGEQNALTLPNRPAAAKTGTTNDYRDAWTIGFTPQLAAGVWVGNNNNKEMKRGADGSVVAAPIWQAFMKRALQKIPAKQFTPPDPRTTGKPLLDFGGSGEAVEIDLASGKRATAATPSSFRATKVFRQYHTILRYLTPGDPLGPPPAVPEADPQYESWERAVRIWAEARGLTDELAPSAFDDAHTDAMRPSISILEPQTNQTITTNPLIVRVATSAPRGVRRVMYLLDGQSIGESKQSPFTLNFPITESWQNGFHTLTATAYDDIDNQSTVSQTFNLLVTLLPTPYQATFSSLRDGETIPPSTNHDIIIDVSAPKLIKQIDLYASREGGPSQWVGVAAPVTDQQSISWLPMLIGTYQLSLTITELSGLVRQGARVLMVVK